jgi:hypothetical protein
MLDTGGYNLKGGQREIIDYMRNVYRIDDIRIRPGGKHLHVEYVYAGQKHKDTLPRGTGGDPNWIDTRKHDLRKYLGEPPQSLNHNLRRSLDKMTDELQAKADLLNTTAIGAVIDPQPKAMIQPGSGKTSTAPPPIEQKHFPCTIGTHQNSTDLSIYLGRDLVEAMDRQYGANRHYTIVYHHPHHWTAHPSREAGRLIESGNHRLRCGGAEAIKRLGKFPASKASAYLRHNRVEFKLLELPNPATPTETVSTVKPVAAATAPFNPPIVIAPPLAVPPPAPPVPPDDPRERLRHVLRLIKQIEDEGTYQLINANGWRWRAADIGLED